VRQRVENGRRRIGRFEVRTADIRAFRRLARRFHRQTGGLLPDRPCCGGITVPQCHVLLELDEMGGATLQALSDALCLDKSTASRTVHALVARGLVKRAANEEDRRCLALTLSPAGVRAAAAIDALGDGNARRVFDAIPRERHAAVVECLRLLVEAGDRVECEGCDEARRAGRRESA
jgi:DNA-binding MarR family transcriptional regulator